MSTKLKQPELSLSGNIAENWRNFETRFNDYCIACDFRDCGKNPKVDTEIEAHYKSAKRPIELATLRLCLPDETLSLLRYSIDPQIPEPDKGKPWKWIILLRSHYTGSHSTKLTDRYIFSAMQQSPTESVQEWEIRVRQAGALCEYGQMNDELCRDKFIFGINERFKDIRTELLKTDKNADNTDKTLAQTATLARALETAASASVLISGSQHTEQVNYTKQRPPRQQSTQFASNPRRILHKELKLKRQPNTCWYCGSSSQHPWRECKARNQQCRNCGYNDHFADVCMMPSENKSNQPQRKPVNQLGTDRTEYLYDEYAYAIESDTRIKSYRARIQLAGEECDICIPIVSQVDTGSTCNTISVNTFRKISARKCLQSSMAVLYPYGKNSPPIHPKGQVLLYGRSVDDVIVPMTFHVLTEEQMSGQPGLLSGSDSERLGLVQLHPSVYMLSSQTAPSQPAPVVKPKFANLPNTSRTLPKQPSLPLTKESFVRTYKTQLFDGLGYLGPPVHFELDKDITPVQMPMHRVPLSKRKEELEFLNKYVEDGILAKVTEPTPWCSNELIREKPATAERPRKFRICIDPSQTINKAIKRPLFQMPMLQENLHKLSKARCFSIIDVKNGFFNIPLDDESSLATTMHTSYGRYRWLRLPFGVSSAPEEFQMRLNTALEGLDNIAIQADDLLVYGIGETDEEAERDHDLALLALAERGIQKDIRFNLPKLKFKIPKAMYNGEIFTKHGMEPDPEKVKAIVEMPTPTDKAGLLRYIGMLTYLSPYCQNLSSVLKPLRTLLQDDQEYLWSSVQNEAFAATKELISKAPVLSYYNMHKPVVLQVDASSHGLGGALLQPDDQNKLRPVAYTSCSLTKTEMNYAQIEKECLAICEAFQKWDFWLYGRSDIIVHTDHQPLVTILNKPLNKAPLRLQRMIMRLQRWSFEIEYRKGTSLHLADTLSRAPLPMPSVAKTDGYSVFRIELSENEHNERLKPDTECDLQRATLQDSSLQKLSAAVITGWPSDRNLLDDDLKPYWTFRDELSVYNGIVYKGNQCVIPTSMQSTMLERIHANHMGAESNTRMARQVLFWPGLRSAITDMCQSCSRCAEYGKAAPTEPMKSLPLPERPWQLLSQDTFELEGKDYLVTVCHFSDWIEVDDLENLTADTIVSKTEAHVARYGAPDMIHTDCAPCFKSAKYDAFSKLYNFKHTFSSPYHSRGNGKAESSVDIAKCMMKKSSNIHESLLMYRNTPPQGHTYSPAQRMFCRQTRTRLPTASELLQYVVVDPNVVRSDIVQRKAASKIQYDKNAGPEHAPIEVGSYAYVKPPPSKRGQKWAYGEVIENSRPRSYTVKTPSGKVCRNRVQIRPAAAPPLRPIPPVKQHPQPFIAMPSIPSIPSSAPAEVAPIIPSDTSSQCSAPQTGVPAEAPPVTPAASSPQAAGLSSPRSRPTRTVNKPSRFKDYIVYNTNYMFAD